MQVILCFLVLISVANAVRSPLITDYEWKYMDYDWESQYQKDYYLQNGLFDHRNMTPIDVDRSIDGRTFVTVIKTAGVPATLHTVSDKRGPGGPLLRPYPNWEWHERDPYCNGIVNVYRVAIDRCNRLWVLDTGSIDETHICPAQLLAFNLYTDRLLFKIRISDDVARNRAGRGLLITPIVETYGKSCDDTTVYMADVDGFGLVIWNGVRTFRLESPLYNAEERNANFSIAGEEFYLADGIFGMALTPQDHPNDSRYLAFRPLASRSLYAAETRVLKRSTDGTRIKYQSGINVLPSQASAMAFSSQGTLFYVLAHELAIGCWNMHRPLTPEYFKIALTDRERLQFASGLKIIPNQIFFPEPQEQLLLMTNRLQKIYAETMNFNEINFRVLRATIKDIVHGTVCDRY